MQALLSPSAVEAGLVALADARATAAQRAAAESFTRAGLPHRRIEAFKWTDFRAALREPLAPAHAPDAMSSFAPRPFEIEACVVEIADGLAGAAAIEPTGIAVHTKLNDSDLPRALCDHPLALLAAATATRRTEIVVDGAAAAPVWIRRVAGPGASASRVRIILAPGATLTLIESFEGQAGSFAADVTEFEVGAGALLTRFVLQDADETAVVAALACASVAKDARFEQAMLVFGGKLARLETHIVLEGEAAAAGLRGASLIAGARHADQTSVVSHQSPGARTRQLYKSAVKDRGRSVFQGKFHVARGAQKTEAHMQANALLLSEGAEAFHKPELEIYADDVTCAHGATSGAVDRDALFYLRQRGLSEPAARALLVEAFVGEVFEGVARPDIAGVFQARIARWLEEA